MKNHSSEEDGECVLPTNHGQNYHQNSLPRKEMYMFANSIILLSYVDTADSAKVIILQIDGKSYYTNFCYINVSNN